MRIRDSIMGVLGEKGAMERRWLKAEVAERLAAEGGRTKSDPDRPAYSNPLGWPRKGTTNYDPVFTASYSRAIANLVRGGVIEKCDERKHWIESGGSCHDWSYRPTPRGINTRNVNGGALKRGSLGGLQRCVLGFLGEHFPYYVGKEWTRDIAEAYSQTQTETQTQTE